MAQTDRLGLPLIAAGQAKKEVTHNEGLMTLDLAVQACAESADLAVPPAAPSAGQCWIVGSGASGAWTGQEGLLAGWTSAGWLFLTPRAGWRIWGQNRQNIVAFDGVGWSDDPVRADGYYQAGVRVLGVQQPAIATPSGGTVVDSEARVALAAILGVLRAHGLIAS